LHIFQVESNNIEGWLRRRSTPSSGTGPNKDHTSSSGYFMYLEASNNWPSMTSSLTTPTLPLVGVRSSLNFSFYYHM